MPPDQQSLPSEHDLTLAIYDAVTFPERWTEVADALQRFVLCDAVDCMLLDGTNGDQIIGHVSNDDLDSHHNQVNDYLATDVRIPQMQAKPPRLIHDQGLLTPNAHKHSPFYNQLPQRSGLMYTMGARLAVAAPFVGVISCGQRAVRGPFREEQRRRLNTVLPHLQRAMCLRLSVWKMQEGNRLLAGALDRLPRPILILDPGGELLHANEGAQRILRANDGLTVRQHYIETVDRSASRRLMTLLREVATATAGRSAKSPCRVLALDRPSGRPPYRLEVHPVPCNTALWRDTQRPALLVFISGDAVAHPSGGCEELLRTIYRLTPAEAALASAFCQGISLREYAERRAISVETVRFQMKQVLAKTECRRQADLARLLAHY